MQEWTVVVHTNDLIVGCAAGLHLKTASAPEFGYSVTDNASLMEQKNPIKTDKTEFKPNDFCYHFF